MTKHSICTLLLCLGFALFLSACSHIQKQKKEIVTFSFMGNEMVCKEKKMKEPEIQSYVCKNEKLGASFFINTGPEEDWFFLEKAEKIIEDAVEDKKTEQERLACTADEGRYVIPMKVFGKGKKNSQITREVLWYFDDANLMFIENKKPQKRDFSILTEEAMKDLCTHPYRFDSKEPQP